MIKKSSSREIKFRYWSNTWNTRVKSKPWKTLKMDPHTGGHSMRETREVVYAALGTNPRD